jgi:GNAT superfamily N-acetyltransferase
MLVSTLDSSNVSAYRELMLEAYEHAADAFTTTAAERQAEPESWWIKRIGSASGLATSFGAWDEGRLVGTVAIEYSAKPKTRHSALVLGMYVTATHRNRGFGRLLMEAAIAAATARPEVLVLTLTLTEGNERALRLYQSLGFSVWGIEPMAIRAESGLRGKVHMAVPLRKLPVAA